LSFQGFIPTFEVIQKELFLIPFPRRASYLPQQLHLILRTPIFIMWGINDQKVAIVIFPSLRMGPESTLQLADQAFRLSAFLDES